MKSCTRALVMLLTILTPILASTTGRASDGVLEINQACADATGCFAGDGPGFPITLAAPGSYRLTGNLTLPSSGVHGIEITSDNVSLDLGGFEISRGGSGSGSGDGIHTTRDFVVIHNGSIRGALENGVSAGNRCTIRNLRLSSNGRDGVNVGDACEVRGVQSVGNSNAGIRMGADGLATNNIATGNIDLGLLLGARTGYAGNTATGNQSGDHDAQLSGGIPIGLNICGSSTCGPVGAFCDTGSGFGTCSGVCLDLANDPANCGACGSSCPTGWICDSGTCNAGCAAGEFVCSGSCVDLLTDESNCGSCGSSCPGGSVCNGGACQ